MKKLFSILTSWALVFLPVSVQALPSGQKVINGVASFNSNKNTMNITASNKAIINYNSFNINQNEIVNFIQPLSSSVVLNRVIKANPSSIMGALNANGKVFLINPAGIVFGANSSVNTNSFLATTLDIKNSDFIGGNYNFSQLQDRLPSYILQKGSIKVSPEGFVVLASPLVKSDGLIFAKSGKIQIAAVDNFYINFDQRGLVNFDYKPIDKTKTDVLISSKVADELMQEVVNSEKITEAIDIVEENGVIKLVGKSGTALVSGELNTDGDTAGSIDVVSQNYTAIINKAKLSSNALKNGDGGNIYVFSDKDSYSSKDSSFLSKSNNGNGGTIELSAKESVVYSGSFVDTSSANGKFGLFYIDPEVIEVVSSNINISSNYFLEATKKITLNNGIKIETNGGDIKLEAPSIRLDENSKLLSGAGDITLKAESAENALIDIKDGVQISGNNINIEASTHRQSEFDSDSDDATSKVLSAVGDFVINMPVTPIAYTDAKTTSTIDIGAANLTGEKITISSSATSDVSVSALFTILALSYGKSHATSSLHVSSGASLNSTGDVTLKSEATSINNVTGRATNILDNTDKQKQANFSLAYSNTEANSDAIIDSGVTIKADNFKLLSIGNKDITTSSNVASFSAGTLGTSVAISDSKSNINSNLSGTVEANSVKVSSITNIERVKASSSAGVGNGFVYKHLLESNADKSAATDKTKTLADSKAPTTKSKSGVSKIALSAAFSYSNQENNSEAKISNANVKANGDITVKSNIIYGENGSYDDNGNVVIIGDKGIKTVAIATIDSTEENQKENSFSGAVVLTDILNNTNAFIADNAAIDAIGGDIGVYSKMYLAYNLEWENIVHFDSIKDIIPKGADLAGFRENLFTSYAQSNAQGTKNSLAGSYNHFKFTTNSDAYIGKNVSINQNGGDGAVEVFANNDIQTLNFAGVIGWTYFGTKAGSTGVGGSYLDVDFISNTRAYIQNGTLINATDIKVAAIKNTHNVSISTAGGSGENAISGSFSSLKTDDDTYAYIDGASITTSDGVNNKFFDDEIDTNLRVNAQNNTEYLNATGGVIKGKNVGVGTSGSINNITRDTQAYIKDSTINRTSSSLEGLDYIKAYNSGFINSFAISGVIASPASSTSTDTQSTENETKDVKGTFGFAVSGDSSVDEVEDKVNAYVEGSTFSQGAQRVKLLAKNNTDIGAYSGSGAFNFSEKSAGLAGSYAGNYFSNQANAYIDNSTLHVKSMDIKAQNSGAISTLSGSGSIGTGKASLAGSVSINKINNKTNSYIDNSAITLSEDLDLISLDDTSIKSLAGALSISKGLGVGLSYAKNKISNDLTSYIQNSSLHVKDISISSKQDNTIQNISASIGASFDLLAAAGAVSVNEIDNLLESYILNIVTSKTILSSGDISIKSLDESNIESIAGFVSGTSSIGVGGSILQNKITNNLNSYIKSVDNIQSQNLIIKSISDKDLTATSTGGTGAGTGSVNGSVLINKISDDINAYVEDSTLLVDKSMIVHGVEQNKIKTYGGTASLAGTVGVGGTVVRNEVSSKISAHIKNSTVDVKGSDSLDTPKKDEKRYEETESFNGLSILAFASEDIEVYTANASGAGTLGFAANANFNTISNKLYSYILNSNINQNIAILADANQKVLVRALSNNSLNINGGGAAGSGTAGVGGALNNNYIKNKTHAYINTSQLNAQKLIEVRAQSVEDITSKVVSGAGAGTVALAGSVSLLHVENENEAEVDKSTILSQEDLSIVSKDNTKVKTHAGIIVGSGVVGVGGSVVINKVKNSSIAHMDNSKANAKDKLYMYSHNFADIENNVASGALGAYIGSGAVVMNTVDSRTKSYTSHEDGYSILINQDPLFVADEQRVDIEAVDYVKVNDALGTTSFGLAGVGGSVDITTLKNDTGAYLGKDTDLFAKKDLNILAKSDKDYFVDSLAYSAAGVGVAGSVVVANLGLSIAEDALNAMENTQSVLNKTINSLSNVELGTTLLASDTKTTLDDEKSSMSVDENFNTAPNIKNKTKAHINTNANVNVGNNINVNSKNIISDIFVQSGGGAGGLIGAGGGVTLVYLGADNRAYTQEGVTIDANSFSFYSDYDAYENEIKSYAGSVGAVGLGADVSRFLHNYINSTTIGENNFIVATNGISIKSDTDEYIHARGYGANIGAAVAGVSKVDIDSEGATSSSISTNSKLYAQGGDGINIISSYSTNIDSLSISAALGAGAAQGTTSDIEIRPTIISHIENDVKLGAQIGDINIKTLFYNTLLSRAKGLNLGGVSVGSSYARAYNNAIINSIIGDYVLINSNNDFRILTYENRYVDTGDRIESRSIESEATSAVGTLIGGIGAKSTTSNHSYLKTQIGKNSKISAKDNIVIKTKSYAKTKSQSEGHAYGVASAGFTGAYTYNDGDTKVDIDNGSELIAKYDILINSYAKKNAYATSKGGEGGLLAGSGTKANAKMDNIVNINLSDDTKVISNYGDVAILSTGNIYTSLYANTKSIGLVTKNSVQSDIEIDKQDIKIDIGNSEIVGKNVHIESKIENLHASSEAYSKTTAGASYSRAYAYLTLASNVGVTVDEATIIGYDSVNIESNQHTDDVFARTTATSTISNSLIGSLKSTVENNPTFKSNVTVKNSAKIQSDDIKIKGSAPNMRKVADYPDTYNYVKYPKVINHSVSHVVTEKVREWINGFWSWVTKRTTKKSWSSSNRIKKGYFRSQKVIDVKDSVSLLDSPAASSIEDYRDQINNKLTNNFASWKPASISGELSKTREPLMVPDPIDVDDDISNLSAGASSNTDYEADEGYFDDIDIDSIPDEVEEIYEEALTQEDVEYIPIESDTPPSEPTTPVAPDEPIVPGTPDEVVPEEPSIPDVPDDPIIPNFPDEVIPNISDDIVIEPNDVLSYRDMLEKYKNRALLIMDNKIVGGKLAQKYMEMMILKIIKINPVFQFKLPKKIDEEDILSSNR